MTDLVTSTQGRVSTFVRDSAPREVSQQEIIDAVKDVPAAQVRLIAKDLRTRGIIAARIEGTTLLYSWVAKRTKDEPALRQPNTAIAPKAPSVPHPIASRVMPPVPHSRASKGSEDGTAGEKILQTLEASRVAKLTIREVKEGVGIESYSTVKKALARLLMDGRINASGKTASRRYFLPSRAVEADLEVKISARVAPAQTTATAPAPARAAAPTPAQASTPRAPRQFSFHSDGSLTIDCERCKGELTRQDLEILSRFVNSIGRLA